jgi:uncharacterized membrane protein YphA (DoxX/SURF4 family)
MDDSMAQPSLDASVPASPLEIARWKSIASTAAAFIIGLLFIVSGAWKLTDPFGWAARLGQMQIPSSLTMPGTLGVGIAEVFGGVMMLVPRLRRWGAPIVAALLLVFMVYFAIYYDVLRGEECSCFPWLKRTVGPGFFIGDALMLAATWVAWKWAPRAQSPRVAVLVLGAITVFAGASYGVAHFENSGIQAPPSVAVAGNPFPLRQGRIFLYFFDPECTHCFNAAKEMATYRWRDVKIVVVPTRQERFAEQFLADTGLKAPITYDTAQLREKFSFTDPPYGVLLENGRQKAAVINFDENEPKNTLSKHGFIE